MIKWHRNRLFNWINLKIYRILKLTISQRHGFLQVCGNLGIQLECCLLRIIREGGWLLSRTVVVVGKPAALYNRG